MKVRYASVTAGALTVFGLLATGLPAQAATPPTEQFTVVQTSFSNSQSTNPMSGSGPINGLGKDVETGNTTDNFVFPKGTLMVTHHKTSGTEGGSKKSCTDLITEKGTYTVTGGTKAYAGATGHGTYMLTGVVLGCDQNKPPVAVAPIIRASGPLSLHG